MLHTTNTIECRVEAIVHTTPYIKMAMNCVKDGGGCAIIHIRKPR